MFQFSKIECMDFQERATKSGIDIFLKDECSQLFSHTLRIPSKGNANWSLYYYCPDCSVQLIFDLEKPHTHTCPSCGKTFSGGVYDGAWNKFLNSFYAEGTYKLGLLYLCNHEAKYARKAIEILLGYATLYPSYQVHGNIPYNGPGKANAQTLDEAIFLRMLAYGYDLVNEAMTTEERESIKKGLFENGLDFLKSHRTGQLHNHEVIIDGAMGVLALLLNDKKSLEYALFSKYGLVYQLEHGVLEDGFWFECSTAYHFFALQNFLSFEKFARHTPYTQLDHPNYQKMIQAALLLLKEDYSFPLLNDSQRQQGQPNGYGLFEFAYKTWKIPRLNCLLHKIYEKQPRISIESFFYGEMTLPPAQDQKFVTTNDPQGLGVSIIRNANQQYLLFRHGPFGGEHDHYDRLGISYSYQGKPVSEDLGTTGYGAALHYGYYKHTGTHNTVVIDEENQPPSKAKVQAFETDKYHSFVDAKVTFTDTYALPDSFTIPQWNVEAYRGVTFRRRLYKTDEYLIDIFEVFNVRGKRSIDFVMHFGGKRLPLKHETRPIAFFSPKEPFSHLQKVCSIPADQLILTSYAIDNIHTDYYAMPFEGTTYLAEGPDNPSNAMIPFYLENSFEESARFVHVLASYPEGEKTVQKVEFENLQDYLTVRITNNQGKQTHTFSWGKEE